MVGDLSANQVQPRGEGAGVGFGPTEESRPKLLAELEFRFSIAADVDPDNDLLFDVMNIDFLNLFEDFEYVWNYGENVPASESGDYPIDIVYKHKQTNKYIYITGEAKKNGDIHLKVYEVTIEQLKEIGFEDIEEKILNP